MADIKFACPNCQQHIQAEPGYAGVQIACPTCRTSIIVPGAVAPPPPLPVPAMAAAAPAYAAAAAIPSAPPLPPARPAAAAVAGTGCPSCGNALPRGAVICTNCGYNLATRQRTVAGRPAALGKPSAPQYEVPWYKTAYPYIGVVVVVLGILYFLGKENPACMLAFLGTAVLYTLTVHILVVIAAFKESVGTGFLTLCIPFFALYFVWKISDNQTLQLLYSVALLINVALKFIA